MENVIRLFSRSFGRTLYVRLRRNEVNIRHVESGREFSADDSFSNSRLLVASSTVAARVLRQGLRTVLPKVGIAPVIVMHPLEMVEGGLSEVEERSLTEIAYAVGAREVYVFTGPE